MEDNIELAQIITQYFNDSGQFEVVGTAQNGESGLALIRSQPVDVAIIDLVLPYKDGFYVLEELSAQPETKPVCIMLTGVSLEQITAKAIAKGADFIVLKPFDLVLLAKRVIEVWTSKRGQPLEMPAMPAVTKEPEAFILNILHEIPIRNTIKGYAAIKAAVLLAIKDPSLLNGITKCLYPEVGKQVDANGPQVERAIRHAITAAWQKGAGRRFAELVGYGGPDAPKPTNSAFISALVELYQQGKY